MAEKVKGFLYTVRGFGDHVESRTVKFLKKPALEQVCNWCGVVSDAAEVLSCLHLVCEDCRASTFNAPGPVCLIDQQSLSQDFTAFRPHIRKFLSTQKVRCVYEAKGCNFEGRLDRLNEHLANSCAYCLVICSTCKEPTAQKDIISHFTACKGAEGVVRHNSHVPSLLEDIGCTRRELQQALEAASDTDRDQLRDAIDLLREQFDGLCKHLASGAK